MPLTAGGYSKRTLSVVKTRFLVHQGQQKKVSQNSSENTKKFRKAHAVG